MRALAGLAMIAALAAPRSVRADDELVRARALEARLEYAQALAVVDTALARGGADPARLVELHLLGGRLAAGLERARVAEDHFAIVLALRPSTTLPEGTSPKLVTPFTAARAKTSPLDIRVTTVRGVVTVLPVRDALRLVRGIAIRVADPAGQWREVVDRNALRLAVPAGMSASEVAALDAAGNQVWTGTAPPDRNDPSAPTGSSTSGASPTGTSPPGASPTGTSPTGASPTGTSTVGTSTAGTSTAGTSTTGTSSLGAASSGTMLPAGARDDGPALYARWTTWAAITGVALASGGIAAWRFRAAQQLYDAERSAQPPPDYSRLSALEERGQRWGLAANISFGAAAVTGVATLVLWLRRPGEPRVVAVPGPGPSVTAAIRF